MTLWWPAEVILFVYRACSGTEPELPFEILNWLRYEIDNFNRRTQTEHQNKGSIPVSMDLINKLIKNQVRLKPALL